MGLTGHRRSARLAPRRRPALRLVLRVRRPRTSGRLGQGRCRPPGRPLRAVAARPAGVRAQKSLSDGPVLQRVCRADEKVTLLVTQLPWTDNLINLSQCTWPEDRDFNLRLVAQSRLLCRHQYRRKRPAPSLLGSTTANPPSPTRWRSGNEHSRSPASGSAADAQSARRQTHPGPAGRPLDRLPEGCGSPEPSGTVARHAAPRADALPRASRACQRCCAAMRK